MNSCEECGRDLGAKAKVYPVVMQPDIFAICVKYSYFWIISSKKF